MGFKVDVELKPDVEIEKFRAIESFVFNMTDGSNLAVKINTIVTPNQEIKSASRYSYKMKDKERIQVKSKKSRILTLDECLALRGRLLLQETREKHYAPEYI